MKKLKKLKSPVTQIGKNIHGCIAMAEEIAEKGMFPVCVIGVAPLKKGSKKVESIFATISDDKESELIILEMCKALLENKGYDVTKIIDTKNS